MIVRGKYDLDVVGHYARPRHFQPKRQYVGTACGQIRACSADLKARFGVCPCSDARYGANKTDNGTEMPRTATKKTRPTTDADEKWRWAAVLARDKSADGRFFFSVATTGVYCHPSCPSRRAKRENVAFHDTCAEAEAAGFRPCRRCRPDELSLDARRAQLVGEACKQIEDSDEIPSINALAATSGLSRFHFHRIFKEVTGVTPKDYAHAHRRKAVRNELKRSSTVTEAIYNAGFNSGSRFYADAAGALGMTPRSFEQAVKMKC